MKAVKWYLMMLFSILVQRFFFVHGQEARTICNTLESSADVYSYVIKSCAQYAVDGALVYLLGFSIILFGVIAIYETVVWTINNRKKNKSIGKK